MQTSNNLLTWEMVFKKWSSFKKELLQWNRLILKTFFFREIIIGCPQILKELTRKIQAQFRWSTTSPNRAILIGKNSIKNDRQPLMWIFKPQNITRLYRKDNEFQLIEGRLRRVMELLAFLPMIKRFSKRRNKGICLKPIKLCSIWFDIGILQSIRKKWKVVSKSSAQK